MMSSKKVFYVMTGSIVLLLVLIMATVFLGDAFLRKQSDKLVGLKLNNQVIEAQSASLIQANKDLEKYAELELIAKQIVPQDKDQARATREIINISEQAGIQISSITFPASTLGQTPVKAPTATATDTPAPKPITPKVTQVKPVEGIKDLLQLDITITSDTTKPATYPKLIDFLAKLEQNRRTSQVSQITIQPDPTNRSGLNFALTLTVYIKP